MGRSTAETLPCVCHERTAGILRYAQNDSVAAGGADIALYVADPSISPTLARTCPLPGGRVNRDGVLTSPSRPG